MKKRKKAEKAWLISVIVWFVLYNLPFVPAYGNAKAAILHGIITLVPLWLSVYIGIFKICKILKLREDKSC